MSAATEPSFAKQVSDYKENFVQPTATTANRNRSSVSTFRALAAIGLAVLVAVAAVAAVKPADAAAAVEWTSEVHQAPTNLQPGERGMIWITPGNAGTDDATGMPTVSFELPAGVSVGTPAPPDNWTCTGSPLVTCTNAFGAFLPVPSEAYTGAGAGQVWAIRLTVDVAAGVPEGIQPFEVTLDGAGGSQVSQSHSLRVGGADLPFGPEPGSLTAGAFDAAGADYTQAGGHPYSASTSFSLNTAFSEIESGDAASKFRSIRSRDNLKAVAVDLPAGFIGDPTAVPQCADLGRVEDIDCPASSQVGVATISPPAGTLGRARMFAVYNMVPAKNTPGQFAFRSPIGTVLLTPTLRSDGDYGIRVQVRGITQIDTLWQSSVTLWGDPSDSSHDQQRCASPNFVSKTCVGHNELNGNWSTAGQGDPHTSNAPSSAFLSNPTSCTGQREPVDLHLTSWENPGSFEADGDPDLSDPNWKSQRATVPEVTGCEKLAFAPEISFDTTSNDASAPTGLDVEIKIPQNESPGGLATAHLKDTTVTLPEGMAVNPSSADGLASCSPEQIGLVQRSPARFDKSEADCPQGSKVASVEVETPLLEDPLAGAVYVAKQEDNPFDSLLALYMVIEGPGLIIKLPGEVSLDSDSGQITATFLENPQVPFETLRLRFKGGARAPLTTPSECGSHTTATEMVSWAEPHIDSSNLEGTVEISGACDRGGFEPDLSAGTVNPAGGEYSPFVTRLTRSDGEEQIRRLDVALPEGLTGKLAGIPYCSEEALASFGDDGVTEPGTAQEEIDDPTCSEASQVGRVTVGAGAGSSPFYLQTGKAYLAGPYRGAPLSLAIVTPAKAGPFDLGSVMVRSALHVDDRTAQITVRSDEIPTILEGIPLKIKDLRVIMDREDFTLNPTNCQATKVWALAMGTSGTHANLENPFQAADCAALGFAPRFGMRVMNRGRKSTLRSFNPRMRFTVAPKAGEANIDRAAVTLPPALILDQGNLDTICTRDQFAARDCPEGSVVGFARAWSPLLDRPVQGRVYLGSSTNQLPDLIADLQGQVPIVLQGRIDSVKGRIRNTFDVVPDVPVTRFQLNMRGGKQQGILVNSTDLCRGKQRGVANFRGQNGVRSLTRPRLALRFKRCKQVRKKAARKNAARKASANRARRSRN